jgi:hypothetical protein
VPRSKCLNTMGLLVLSILLTAGRPRPPSLEGFSATTTTLRGWSSACIGSGCTEAVRVMQLGSPASGVPLQTVPVSGGQWTASGLQAGKGYTLYAVHSHDGTEKISPPYTYATVAGAPQPPSAAPEGGTLPAGKFAGRPAGRIAVTATGSAHYSIPIAVPPGTNRVEPRISLEFDSQAGISVAGVGWSIGGLPSITRCPTTLANDGFLDPVDYDTSDRFCLDGRRMVPIGGFTDVTFLRTDPETDSAITQMGTFTNPHSFGVTPF